MKVRIIAFALACTALTSMSAPVTAADLPLKARGVLTPVSVSSWNGFYVGAHVGIGFNEDEELARLQRFTGGGGNPQPLQTTRDRSFLFGGGQLGYNHQMGRWVLGVEADASLRTGRSVAFGEGPIALAISNNGNWYGTVRGRLGWLWSNEVLLYGTGGWAFGQNRFTATITGPGPIGTFDFSQDRWVTGWVAGAGVEKMLAPGLSAKLEYQYVSLSASDTRIIQFNAGQRGVFTINGLQPAHTFQFGMNYRFWML